MHDFCLEASQFQPLKISRFPKEIIYDIDLTLPINTGKGSSVLQVNKN